MTAIQIWTLTMNQNYQTRNSSKPNKSGVKLMNKICGQTATISLTRPTALGPDQDSSQHFHLNL